MTSFILYGIGIILCIISFIKDKEKTKQAFINGLKSLENIMPQFLFIAILVGVILSILNPASISNLIGKDSGLSGITISSILGSITTIPTFVAFSTGDSLLKSGAGYAQVAAFISTSTMVGILTLSLEAKYIGKKVALYRNCLAFIFSFVVAIMIGGILG
ncbi:permease [Paeniclostridium hominis]|uniref:permease n=1 Tax=Paeniclostridium hominis TaxID=2764329 RepID=UPI0022E79ED0|nr:permease [Paeniclostridium hominis]